MRKARCGHLNVVSLPTQNLKLENNDVMVGLVVLFLEMYLVERMSPFIIELLTKVTYFYDDDPKLSKLCIINFNAMQPHKYIF